MIFQVISFYICQIIAFTHSALKLRSDYKNKIVFLYMSIDIPTPPPHLSPKKQRVGRCRAFEKAANELISICLDQEC